jgi:quercetin dioxygenase-like cupin family protein
LIDVAALDAAGALDAGDRVSFLTRLAGADDAERQAVASVYEAVASAVVSSIVPQDVDVAIEGPSPSVRQRLMERIAAAAQFFSVRSSEGRWQKVMEGIETKLLRFDAERQTATLLMRFAAGVVYPGHQHSGPEECYVISGDVIIQGQHLHAGDFHYADAGSEHDPLTSVNGGEVLLVVAAADYHGGA